MELQPGVYEALVSELMEAELRRLRGLGHPIVGESQPLDRLEEALARHLYEVARRALRDLPKGDRRGRLALIERALSVLDDEAPRLGAIPGGEDETLTWIGPPPGSAVSSPEPPGRPHHGLVHPSLIFNGRQDLSLVSELKRELESADSVDAVVAFLKFSGLRLIRPSLRRFFDRGGHLRLVASTYTGVTDARAVHELAELGAQVRIAREDNGTRLHAKAWMFRRTGGLSTAYIGSSNLSAPALTDGAEWNVRVTQARTPDLIDRFATAFSQLWERCAPDFEAEVHGEELVRALQGSRSGVVSDLFVPIDAAPKPHQEEVLDALDAERERGHSHNLVVAATGTGKTWIAAFDYRRQCAAGRRPTLLFVAHRKEILRQSLTVYRMVLSDPDFGELLVDGARPRRGSHVFASIQSLREQAIEVLDPDAYEVVVVDEFHHAAARSYDALLSRLKPAILLGLTATPERADGQSILPWFDGRIAAELRLWDALEQDLLAPFHYFGVEDPTSAERAWRRGRLDVGELDNLYSADDLRARRILEAVHRYVSDPRRMRALGFCVGVGHAMIMARAFNEAGLKAVAVHGGTPAGERQEAQRRLLSGDLCALFTVDLFNEGVDLPGVDTVLFLRPTESATVFLQQLGRGLRKCAGKSVLTALDFVGHVHEDFRYEVRFQAMLGKGRRAVERSVIEGFPRLPAGSAIQLEPGVQERVLASLKRSIGAGWRRMVRALRSLGPTVTLRDFLDDTGVELADVYRTSGNTGWTALRRAAGFEARPAGEGEAARARALARTLHIDDPQRLTIWRAWLRSPSPPDIDGLDPTEVALARMLMVLIADRRAPLDRLNDELRAFWIDHAPLREELVALLDLLDDRLRHTSRPTGDPIPLRVHATYTRDEIIAAWGLTSEGRLREVREGVAFDAERAVELLFVTLDKSDDAFRPAIRYADYPLSPTRFHWESQNRTTTTSPTGQRYVGHRAQGVQIQLFVRARRKDDRGRTLPYAFLGPVHYVRHQGEKPMQIVWELETPMPAWVQVEGAAAAG